MSDFAVVFDVARTGYRQWWFPAVGLLGVPVGWFIARVHGMPGFRGTKFRLAPYLMLLFAVVWVSLTFAVTFADYWNLRTALRRRSYLVVQGQVTEYWQSTVPDKAHERFVVSGRRYEYSDAGVIAGYNNTASQGGVIMEGLCVRIYDVGGEIARLEVATDIGPCVSRVEPAPLLPVTARVSP